MFVARQNRTAWILPALVLSSLSSLFIATSVGDDLYWNNPSGGSYSNPDNWNPAGPPGFEDIAVFDLDTTGYAVTGFGPWLVKEIQVNNDVLTGFFDNSSFWTTKFSIGHAAGTEGKVSLSDSNFEINPDNFLAPFTPDGGLWVGEQGKGTLHLADSHKLDFMGNFIVGDAEEAVGVVTMDDSQLYGEGYSQDEHPLSTTIGRHGTGSLSATNQSDIELTGTLVVGQELGSVGTISLDDSELLMGVQAYQDPISTTIGAAGTGSLVLTNESEALIQGFFVAGESAGSQGAVSVDNSELEIGGYYELDVTIGAAGNGSLTATNGSKVDIDARLVVGQTADSQGAIMVDNSTFVFEDRSATMTIGAAGNGFLEATNGALVDVDGPVIAGQEAGSQGLIAVDNSRLDLNGELTTIGKAGYGSLAATNGAEVNVYDTLIVAQDSGSQGMVTVDNAYLELERSSNVHVIGAAGDGSLTVSNGAEVNIYDEFIVGQEAGSQGAVTIDNSRWNGESSDTIVGATGNGTMSATNGAEVFLDDYLIVGEDAGSQGMVTVDNSKWTSERSPIVVGAAGSGSMTIANSADVMIEDLILGSAAGSQGEMCVSNSSLDVYDSSKIGEFGNGSLTVTSNSEVLIDRLSIGERSGSKGEVTVDNSLLSADLIEVGVYGDLEVGRATLSIANGSQVSTSFRTDVGRSGTVYIDETSHLLGGVLSYGLVHNDGSISGGLYNGMGAVLTGDGTIEGSLSLNPGSEIAPGNSPGTLTVEDVYWGSDATFRFMINGAEGEEGSDPGWNSLISLGVLNLVDSPTDPMRVSLQSLLPNNEAGDVFDFNPEKSYLWTFATATEGIFGFAPENFFIDTTDFTNPTDDGYFEIRQIGNSLAVAYVPEPSTWILALIAVAGLFAYRRSAVACR